MSSKLRKKTIQPKGFESIGMGKIPGTSLSETFLTVYESMLRSPAFMSLSTRQRLLYVYCKSQYYGKRKPEKDYGEIETTLDEKCFYFSRKQAVDDYKLYSESTVRFMYQDMRELEKKGFIKIVSSGKPNHKKSIYQFSEDWKYWSDKE